jgi:zinc and cadmium transporter
LLLGWILASTLLVSLVSLVGIIFVSLKEEILRNLLLTLVGLAAGGLMGGALFHLLPESLERMNSMTVSLYVVAGFVLFFILERILFWRHCHEENCDVHAFTYLNLIGDGIHNFIDGATIAISFSLNIKLGLFTTLAIVLHEIPQEIGDFGILVYGGFSKLRALVFNFLSACSAILGALIGYFFTSYVSNLSFILLPFAAGGFLYIASSDLIPELHKERDFKKSNISFIFFLGGLLIMWFAKVIFKA